jgi:hypothetical protein
MWVSITCTEFGVKMSKTAARIPDQTVNDVERLARDVGRANAGSDNSEAKTHARSIGDLLVRDILKTASPITDLGPLGVPHIVASHALRGRASVVEGSFAVPLSDMMHDLEAGVVAVLAAAMPCLAFGGRHVSLTSALYVMRHLNIARLRGHDEETAYRALLDGEETAAGKRLLGGAVVSAALQVLDANGQVASLLVHELEMFLRMARQLDDGQSGSLSRDLDTLEKRIAQNKKLYRPEM